MPYDMSHTQIEIREERIKLGKNVDSGNNMITGIGGLDSFSGMCQENYKDLLEGDWIKNFPMEKNIIYRNKISDLEVLIIMKTIQKEILDFLNCLINLISLEVEVIIVGKMLLREKWGK